MKINNIAVICYSTCGGGAERATCMWVQSMLNLGKKVLWIHNSAIGDRTIEHENIEYCHLPLDDQRQAKLKELLLQYKIDFCYDINPDDVMLLDDIKTIKGCGCLAGSADHSCYFYPLYTLRPSVYLKRMQVLREADLVTALSPENVAWFKADGVKNVVCMPNYLTFDTKVINCQRVDISDKELLFVGRLCEIKSPERILRVVAELKKDDKYNDIHLTLLGRFDNPDMEKYLRTLTDSLGIHENINFAGEVLDVESYFQKAKLLLMASYMEGAPMVINEAKAYGIPTIMFSLPYVPGTKESEGVISVCQDDIHAMVRSIKQCIEYPEYYNELSNAAKNSLKILSNIELDKKWIDIFDKLERGEDVSPISTDTNKMLQTTMDISRLIFERFSKYMDLIEVQHSDLDSHIKHLSLSLDVVGRKNKKHLRICRILIIYSVLVSLMLISRFLSGLTF